MSGAVGLGSKAMLGIAMLCVAGLLLAGCLGAGSSQPTTTVQTATTQASSPATSIRTATTQASPMTTISENKTGYEQTTTTIQAMLLADGTYTNMVTYQTHAGSETVNVSITVQNDVVTAASVSDDSPNSPISAHLISSLNAALPALVVGKPIDQLNIPHNVAGSSLTTAAFAGYVNSLLPSGSTGSS